MKHILFVSLFLSSFSLFAQDSLARTQVQGLLQAAHDTLVYRHPGTQTPAERERMRRVLNDLLSTADQIPGGDSVHLTTFINHAAAFQQTLGDGHLELTPNFTQQQLTKFKTRQRWITVYDTEDAGLVLRADLPLMTGDTLRAGTPVSHLDGKPIREIMQENASFRGLNDHGYSNAGYRMAGYSLSYVYRSMYGLRDSTLITYSDSTGATARQWIDLRYTVPQPTKEDLKQFKRNPAGLIDYRMLPQDSIWQLRVSTFSTKTFGARKVNFYREIRNVFREINENPGKGLIIDLRGNTGGGLYKAMEIAYYLADEPFQLTEAMESRSPNVRGKGFFGYLVNRFGGGVRKRDGLYYSPAYTKMRKPYKEKKQYPGRVVVLVNESTFSGGTMLAHGLRQTANAKIIGAVAGGSSEQLYGGKFKFYPIGEAGILRMRIPDRYIRMWRPIPGNLTPDYIVPIPRRSFTGEDHDPRVDKAVAVLLEGKD